MRNLFLAIPIAFLLHAPAQAQVKLTPWTTNNNPAQARSGLGAQPANTNLDNWAKLSTNVLGSAGISNQEATNVAKGVVNASNQVLRTEIAASSNSVYNASVNESQARLNGTNTALKTEIYSASNSAYSSAAARALAIVAGTTNLSGKEFFPVFSHAGSPALTWDEGSTSWYVPLGVGWVFNNPPIGNLAQMTNLPLTGVAGLTLALNTKQSVGGTNVVPSGDYVTVFRESGGDSLLAWSEVEDIWVSSKGLAVNGLLYANGISITNIAGSSIRSNSITKDKLAFPVGDNTWTNWSDIAGTSVRLRDSSGEPIPDSTMFFDTSANLWIFSGRGLDNLSASKINYGVLSPLYMGSNVVLTGSAVTSTNFNNGVTTYTVNGGGSSTGVTNTQDNVKLGGVGMTNGTITGNISSTGSNYLASVYLGAATFPSQLGTNLTFDSENFEVTQNNGSAFIRITNVNVAELTVGQLIFSNLVGTISGETNITYQTNLSTLAPDFNKPYSAITTNDAFTWLAPVNTSATQAKSCTVFVTNSTATAKAVTPHGAWKTQGVWFVTNVTAFSIFQYGNIFTNAIALPLW